MRLYYAELNAVHPDVPSPARLADWLESARARVVAPVLARVRGSRSLHSLCWQDVDGDYRSRPFDERAWDDRLRVVAAGDVRHLGLEYCPNERGLCGVEFIHRCPTPLGDDGHTLRFYVSEGYYRLLPKQIRSDLTELFLEGAASFQAQSGFITIDHVGSRSPWEELLGRDAQLGRQEADRKLRGFYWGNLLGSRHVDALGGEDEVGKNAPCRIVRTYADSAGAALVYLQVTESPDDVSSEQLRALKEFLAPVLADAERATDVDHGYRGPKLAVDV
jgi:hypothetical protein